MYKLITAFGVMLVGAFLVFASPAKAMPVGDLSAAAVELGTAVQDVRWRHRRHHRRWWWRHYGYWGSGYYYYAPVYGWYGYGWYPRRYWGYRRWWW